MSSARTATATAATGMALVPPAAFALAAVGQRLLARRKKPARQCSDAEHGKAAEPERRRRRGGRRVLSVGVGAASIGLLVAGASELGAAETTLDPRHPSQTSALVTTGVFDATRNPLYLGLAGLLVAHALWLRSGRALVPAGGFVLAIDQLQIPAEEAALAEKFGRAYRAYCEQVPRWLLR
ncbi:methyltransferase family protein [Ruania zhangjianzhongii]|uniref:methyltransferase family protein n=1 Tax=Ruania zhangjianzhongii TaxID=2603206 RepID=UPI001AEF9B31|nr:isoprenylcysteine carboxylmethyltransferase family protein [Ruania zhangjianzhongii]